MYLVVIADDEDELRKAIIRKVDWEAIGFCVVGDANNGAEALELVEKLEPDLLLTDIKMPFLSGIELARKVREVRPATHIAFLSGFDDFRYAQQAIHYNIISYMLKPISATDLTKELETIKKKIDTRYQEFMGSQNARMESNSFVMPLLLDSGINLHGEQLESELKQQAIQSGLLQNENNAFQYVVMVTTVTDQTGRNCTNHSMVHSLELILKKYVRYSCFYSNYKIVSLLIATAADFDKYLHILVEDIVQSMERIMQLTAVVGISRISPLLSGCHEAYLEATNAISYAENGEANVHYIADEEPSGEWNINTLEGLVTELETRIKSGSGEELNRYIQEIFQDMKNRDVHKGKLNFIMIQLLSAVCKTVHAVTDRELVEELGDNVFMQNITFQKGSLAEMENQFREFCFAAQKMITEQKKKSSEVFCSSTLDIIEHRYGDSDLSLVGISNEINISPNYLSMLIKKETGSTFVELLTKKRIEVAKNLLLSSSMKVREISEKCGYNDQHYFSYCFKKYTGQSPNMLRSQAIQ